MFYTSLNSNLTNLINKTAFELVYSNYNSASRTYTYTASDYAVIMVMVTSYAGNNAGAGLWLVTCYASNSTNGNVTQIVNNTNDSNTSVTCSGTTISITARGNIKVYAVD